MIKEILKRMKLESNENVIALYVEAIDRIFNPMSEDNIETVSKEGFDRFALEAIIDYQCDTAL